MTRKSMHKASLLVFELSLALNIRSCVIERTITSNPFDPYIRLVGNTTGRGLLFVLTNERWGTVCDDSFTTTDAEVVCAQLGLTGGQVAPRNFDRCPNSLPILMTDVACSGTENTLFSCNHRDANITCNRAQDVEVICGAAALMPVEVPQGQLASWTNGLCSVAWKFGYPTEIEHSSDCGGFGCTALQCKDIALRTNATAWVTLFSALLESSTTRSTCFYYLDAFDPNDPAGIDDEVHPTYTNLEDQWVYCDMQLQEPTATSESSAVISRPSASCDTSLWVDREYHCGNCTAIITITDIRSTCDQYCAAQPGVMFCIGAWEEVDTDSVSESLCLKRREYTCNFNFRSIGTSDAICQCTSVRPTLSPTHVPTHFSTINPTYSPLTVSPTFAPSNTLNIGPTIGHTGLSTSAQSQILDTSTKGSVITLSPVQSSTLVATVGSTTSNSHDPWTVSSMKQPIENTRRTRSTNEVTESLPSRGTTTVQTVSDPADASNRTIPTAFLVGCICSVLVFSGVLRIAYLFRKVLKRKEVGAAGAPPPANFVNRQLNPLFDITDFTQYDMREYMTIEPNDDSGDTVDVEGTTDDNRQRVFYEKVNTPGMESNTISRANQYAYIDPKLDPWLDAPYDRLMTTSDSGHWASPSKHHDYEYITNNQIAEFEPAGAGDSVVNSTYEDVFLYDKLQKNGAGDVTYDAFITDSSERSINAGYDEFKDYQEGEAGSSEWLNEAMTSPQRYDSLLDVRKNRTSDEVVDFYVSARSRLGIGDNDATLLK